MVQTYVHLNNTEVDKAVLTSYGIRVVEDKKRNKIVDVQDVIHQLQQAQDGVTAECR
jgi:hypothetical protein